MLQALILLEATELLCHVQTLALSVLSQIHQFVLQGPVAAGAAWSILTFSLGQVSSSRVVMLNIRIRLWKDQTPCLAGLICLFADGVEDESCK